MPPTPKKRGRRRLTALRDAFGSGIDRIEGWVAWVNNWSDLAGWGEAWEMGGGHQRAVWEQQPNNWSDLAGDDGGDGGRRGSLP